MGNVRRRFPKDLHELISPEASTHLDLIFCYFRSAFSVVARFDGNLYRFLLQHHFAKETKPALSKIEAPSFL